MRIALLTLAVAALAFIGSIIWIFANKNGINLFPATESTSIRVSSEVNVAEILKDQWKTEYRIKELEKRIEELSGKSNSNTPVVSESSSGKVIGWVVSTNSGTVVNIVPISAKFLSKIITKVNLSIIENNGIYGLYIFDNSTQYSTYSDKKTGLSVIASRLPYASWLKNFQSISDSLYTVAETKTYPFPSFYVNAVKNDAIIRIVMQVETQTLLIAIPKSKLTEFKTMMNKK